MTARASLLLVEENGLLRAVVEMALTEAGYQVTCSASGEEARRQCRERSFAAAVIDTDLPDMSGFELAAHLRRRTPGGTTPVIFMTAWREPGLQLKAAAAGGVRLLLKPFPLAALLRAVEDCLSCCGDGAA